MIHGLPAARNYPGDPHGVSASAHTVSSTKYTTKNCWFLWLMSGIEEKSIGSESGSRGNLSLSPHTTWQAGPH
jgi:hypothetical protein